MFGKKKHKKDKNINIPKKEVNVSDSGETTKLKPVSASKQQNIPSPQVADSPWDVSYQAGSNSGGKPALDLDNLKQVPLCDENSATEPTEGAKKRKKERKKKKRNKVLKILLIIFVSLLVACGIACFVYLSHTDIFKIDNIVIEGVEHLTEEEMLQLADVPEESNLLNVDSGVIETRLKKDAWIEKVWIDRAFPNTLVIKVKERSITAIVEVPTPVQNTSSNASNTVSKDSKIRNWAISKDHMWLMPVPDKNSEAAKNINKKIYDDVDGVMHIIDVSPSVNPEIGSYCSDDTVNCAIDVVAAMTTDLKNLVKNVKASDPNSTTLILNNGVEVSVGTADDLRAKELVCLEILKKYEGRVTYINVRSATSPTWRML